MVPRPRLALALLASALIGAGVLAGAAAAPAATPDAASIRDADTAMIVGWASHDLTTMAAEETAFGTTNDMLSTYVDFVQSPDFPHDYADAAEARGAALMIAWEPWDWNRPADDQPEFAPRLIAAGDYDAHLTEWLTDAAQRTDDAEIIVRFAPEMDDSTRPWSSGTAPGANTPAEYIAMWRHVYDLKQAIAPEVVLLWNPLNFGAGPYPFESYFPGSAYVDALALDGFNWGYTAMTQAGWQSPDDVFGFSSPTGPVPRLKALAGSKPWGFAEVASAPDSPSDFQPGGPGYGAWGSWVYQWPENAPYETTADDWITQEGWSRMLLERARDSGASFVDFFHTVKETDWRLTDTAIGQGVLASGS
ncbi:hypothetical protein [Streptomyces sp. AC495_CC817]|uniref:hypothetical protein n=1 Tax=Streptomyces sp. AC495_CC817 TaxID=2823900 RepID=UPI001C27D18E|nr:hypothetical protein [Streptomyces sp. AC495_CC817]